MKKIKCFITGKESDWFESNGFDNTPDGWQTVKLDTHAFHGHYRKQLYICPDVVSNTLRNTVKMEDKEQTLLNALSNYIYEETEEAMENFRD